MAILALEDSWETFFINNFIFVIKKAQPPKIVGTSYIPNTFNGYPDILSVSREFEISRQYFAPLNSCFKEKSPWVPMLVALSQRESLLSFYS